MNGLQVIRALGPIDARGIWRDSLLRWVFGAALAIGIAFRFGVPPLTSWLARERGFDLVPYYPLLMSFLLGMLPIIVGTIVGFLLLDERDDQTLTALQVSPLPMTGYLTYRLGAPVVASVVLTVVAFWIAGIGSVATGPLFVAAIAAAPLAPLFALYLAAFANNKVQGFALAKSNGFLTIPPLAAWFVDPPYEYVFAVVPTYWPVKLYWRLEAGQDVWWLLLVGVAFQLLLLKLLVKRFERVLRR